MMGATGDIISNVELNELIEIGAAAKPKIIAILSDAVSGPTLPKGQKEYFIGKRSFTKEIDLPYADAYRLGIVENDYHNRAVIRVVAWLTDHGKRTVVFTRKKEQWKRLKDMAEAQGISTVAIWGATKQEDREAAKKAFTERKAKCLIANNVLDEGSDVEGIEALVMAEGVSVNTNAIQRVGRGTRRKKDGDNEVWVVDIIPTSHETLTQHGLDRVRVYEGEGYEVFPLYAWPAVPENRDSLLWPFLRWEDAMQKLHDDNRRRRSRSRKD